MGLDETRSSIVRVWQREPPGRSIVLENCWVEVTTLPLHLGGSVAGCLWLGGDRTSMADANLLCCSILLIHGNFHGFGHSAFESRTVSKLEQRRRQSYDARGTFQVQGSCESDTEFVNDENARIKCRSIALRERHLGECQQRLAVSKHWSVGLARRSVRTRTEPFGLLGF
jgi:hypothetical protein